MFTRPACWFLFAAVLLSGCSYEAYNRSGVSSHTRVGVHGYYDTVYDDFFFYPDVNVYLGINSGRYFYRPGSRWLGVRVLPGHISLHPSYRVRIDHLPRHRPYRYYRDHHDRYRMRR